MHFTHKINGWENKILRSHFIEIASLDCYLQQANRHSFHFKKSSTSRLMLCDAHTMRKKCRSYFNACTRIRPAKEMVRKNTKDIHVCTYVEKETESVRKSRTNSGTSHY